MSREKSEADNEPRTNDTDRWGLTPNEWSRINPTWGRPKVSVDPLTGLTLITLQDGTQFSTRHSQADWQMVSISLGGHIHRLPAQLVERFNRSPRPLGNEPKRQVSHHHHF